MSAAAVQLPAVVRGLVPAPIRLRLAHAWAEWTSAAVGRELASLARGGRPIVVGPWLGEVGFELLYWIPFLDWAVSRFGIEPSRLTIVSRGGTAAWYRQVATRYRDVFELVDPDAFRARNLARSAEIGEQKQTRPTAFEREIVTHVAREAGLGRADVLHPSLMYRAFHPYWWGHRGLEWVHRHARFRLLPAPEAGERPADLPRDYVAVKFYYNEAFPPTDANRALAARVVRTLAHEGPVVSLATGLRVDDHDGWEEEEAHARRGIRAGLTPSTNLGVQSVIVAGARACVGTYGGFAYLAPFHGVPCRAYYSREGGFSRRHLALAQAVFDRFAPGLLSLEDAGVAELAR